MATPTIKEDEVVKTDDQVTLEPTPEETPSKEGEETPSEETPEGDEDDEAKAREEQDTIAAKQLYNALRNPNTQTDIIRLLAQQAGLLETKSDVKEAKNVIQDVLKQELGQEFGFLAEKLSPAINKILEMQKAETEKRFTELSSKQMQAQLEREVDSTLAKLEKETKGESKKLESRISELMDDILPSKDISTDKYIRSLYKIASSEQSEKAAKRKMAEKINRNANDISSRVSASGGRSGGTDGSSSRMTLDQALQYALQKHST